MMIFSKTVLNSKISCTYIYPRPISHIKKVTGPANFAQLHTPYFSPKLYPRIMFFYTSLAVISSFANIDGPILFLLLYLEC